VKKFIDYLTIENLNTLNASDKGDGKFNNLVEDLKVLLNQVLAGDDVTESAHTIYNKIKTASTDNKAAQAVFLISTALYLLNGNKSIAKYKDKTASASARLNTEDNINQRYLDFMNKYTEVEKGLNNG
jgi:hypothetical protein